MKKSQKGFTLVELIVVIAIIGVLAAILVPSMMGYVKKSRLKKANSNAKLVFNTAASECTEQETLGQPVGAGTYTGNKDTSTTGTGIESAVAKALSNNGGNVGEWGCTIDGDGNVSNAQWRESSTDETVGQWPNPASDPASCSSWAY